MGALFVFSLGILYANILEWFVHKHLFHGLGKKKGSMFAFHLRDHHIESRNNDFLDLRVTKRETFGILGLLVVHLPIYFHLSSIFYVGLVVYGVLFLVLHKLMHTSPASAQKYFWWHWNHHMRNQNKSWGVVLPLTDLIVGSLEPKEEQ